MGQYERDCMGGGSRGIIIIIIEGPCIEGQD